MFALACDPDGDPADISCGSLPVHLFDVVKMSCHVMRQPPEFEVPGKKELVFEMIYANQHDVVD